MKYGGEMKYVWPTNSKGYNVAYYKYIYPIHLLVLYLWSVVA